MGLRSRLSARVKYSGTADPGGAVFSMSVARRLQRSPISSRASENSSATLRFSSGGRCGRLSHGSSSFRNTNSARAVSSAEISKVRCRSHVSPHVRDCRSSTSRPETRSSGFSTALPSGAGR
jgi:hypothetical protein